MSKHWKQLEEDRALRDAALALVKTDIEHLRGDVEEKGLAERAGESALMGAVDIFDEGKMLFEQHKPASYGVGGILAMILAWWVFWSGSDDKSDAGDDYAWDEE